MKGVWGSGTDINRDLNYIAKVLERGWQIGDAIVTTSEAFLNFRSHGNFRQKETRGGMDDLPSL
jgi:hypothetical protein